RPRDARRIRLEDAGSMLNDARERLVARLFLVWEAPSPENAPVACRDEGCDFPAQARLADARRPDQGHEVRSLLANGPAPDRTQQLELPVATDEGCGAERTVGGCGGRLDRAPGFDRVRLA